MFDRDVSHLSEAELLSQLAECISLEGEAKVTAEPLRRELLRRQSTSGEITIEHDGWQSTLTREKFSAAWVERDYGYPKEEIPGDCFDESMTLVLNSEKVGQWLEEKGHKVFPSYSLRVGRKKQPNQKKAR
jgi:hypothetical protein